MKSNTRKDAVANGHGEVLGNSNLNICGKIVFYHVLFCATWCTFFSDYYW